MRLFLFALAVVLTVLGCSDGKLNLLLVFWGDHEESSSSREWKQDEAKSSYIVVLNSSSSYIVIPIPSSSSEYVPPPSSSEEEPPSSSSKEISSSSSSEPPSSSSRPARSSSAKTDDNGYTYPDYPTLEVGAPGVKKGVTTRYYDGCKPSCSYYGNIDNKQKPWTIARACDKNGKNEIPLIYKHHSSDQWGTYYNRVPNAMEPDADWVKSQTYKDWVNTHPDFPKGSFAYTCFDMIPHTVNDTLAYAFVATDPETLPCGKCAALQFDGTWPYDMDKDGESKSRVTHRALKGKTLIVIANNTGTVGKNHFDIMFPGGGLGANDCFTEQIGLPKGSSDLGMQMGGLLSECSYNIGTGVYGKPSDRFSLEEWQQCLADRCHRAFDRLTKKGERNLMLEGCLWSAEWFYASDNPNVDWKEVDCPQYLLDMYKSNVTTELPACSNNSSPPCQIWGLQTN